MSRLLRALSAAMTTSALLLSTLVALAPPVSAAASGGAVSGVIDGEVVLAVAPPGIDTDWLERTVSDPFTLLTAIKPLQDFVRVCGPNNNIGAMAVLKFQDNDAAGRAISKLTGEASVRFAQRNYRVTPMAEYTPGQPPGGPPSNVPTLPNDPEFGNQWNLRNTGQLAGNPPKAGVAGYDIRVLQAWAQGAWGQGQVIAVLDEGMDTSHPDLVSKLWTNDDEIPGNGIDDDGNGWIDDRNGWNYVQNTPHPRPRPHGTAVAAAAAAATNNSVGIAGVAPEAKLMPVDWITTDPTGYGGLGALGGFAYAVANGANVINNSWGFIAPAGVGSPIMVAAVKCANDANIMITWAAGNFGAVPDSWPAYYPAENSIVVTSYDNRGCPQLGHHQDPALVDVTAPGRDIRLPWIDHQTYDYRSGTSYAAPQVAGVAAIVRSLYPTLTAAQTAGAIRVGARREFIEPWTRSLGYLSAEAALEAARTGQFVPPPMGMDPSQSSALRCAVS